MVLLNLGEMEMAQTHLEQGLRLREAHLDADHPFVAVSLQNVGLCYIKLQAYQEAEAYLERALAVRQKAFGRNHPHTARSFNAFGIHVIGRRYGLHRHRHRRPSG